MDKNKEIIWAPWRMGYVGKAKEKGCFLCKAFNSQRDPENLIVFRGKHLFVIMNLFPYNNGHIMIVPNRHIRNFESLLSEETEELALLTKTSLAIYKKTLKAEGFNLGANLGIAAGAGLDTHLHFHIVPRWKGDTNFMPVISDSKVISQSLEELYKILRVKFSKALGCKET